MWGREAKPDQTGKQTLKYPILRQGAVNIPARGSEAVEQEDNLQQPKDNGDKYAALISSCCSSCCATAIEATCTIQSLDQKRVDEKKRIRSTLASRESVLIDAEKSAILSSAQALE
jgi:hypothetical protein